MPDITNKSTTMIIRKETTGVVVQYFDTNTGKFTSQQFIAGDEVIHCDDATGKSQKPIKPYLQFDMVQPEDIEE